MRIRIVASNPPEDIGYSDITEHVGKEYEISKDKIFKFDPTGKEAMGVFIEELDIEVYDGEFEVIG